MASTRRSDRRLSAVLTLVLALTATFGLAGPAGVADLAHAEESFKPPKPDHIVIVVMENKDRSSIIGSAKAPYINSLAKQGANMMQSYGVTHPSQPNYIAMFFGEQHGVTSNKCRMLDQDNLGTQLIAKGLTFTGYAESLPSVGSTACSADGGLYERKHVPWASSTKLPDSTNQPFSAFPSDFTQLPTVSIVAPNMCSDMHDCSVRTGDNWVRENLDGYAQWAKENNSLLVLTFDENDGGTVNQIATVIVGESVRPGLYAEPMNHYNLLRTIEDAYELPPLGNAATAASLATIWNDSPLPVDDLADGVINGGFENGLGGWATSGTTALVEDSHNGFLAAAAGSKTGSRGDSIISQTVVVPTGLSKLTVWWRGDCVGQESRAYATIVLKNNSTGKLTTVLPKTCSTSTEWQRLTVPVSDERSYTLRVVNHSDRARATANITYVDDLTLS